MKENTSEGSGSLPLGKSSGRSIRRLCSHELFAGQSRLLIEHDGIEYLLQITRQGKLILTK
jgi:hemin uptake protein HemP